MFWALSDPESLESFESVQPLSIMLVWLEKVMHCSMWAIKTGSPVTSLSGVFPATARAHTALCNRSVDKFVQCWVWPQFFSFQMCDLWSAHAATSRLVFVSFFFLNCLFIGWHENCRGVLWNGPAPSHPGTAPLRKPDGHAHASSHPAAGTAWRQQRRRHRQSPLLSGEPHSGGHSIHPDVNKAGASRSGAPRRQLALWEPRVPPVPSPQGGTAYLRGSQSPLPVPELSEGAGGAQWTQHGCRGKWKWGTVGSEERARSLSQWETHAAFSGEKPV